MKLTAPFAGDGFGAAWRTFVGFGPAAFRGVSSSRSTNLLSLHVAPCSDSAAESPLISADLQKTKENDLFSKEYEFAGMAISAHTQ